MEKSGKKKQITEDLGRKTDNQIWAPLVPMDPGLTTIERREFGKELTKRKESEHSNKVGAVHAPSALIPPCSPGTGNSFIESGYSSAALCGCLDYRICTR